MKYEVTVHGKTRTVEIESAGTGLYRLRFEGEEHLVDLVRPTPEAFQMLIDGASWEAGCVPTEGGYMVDVMGSSSEVEVLDPRRKALKLSGGTSTGMVSTSMPGRVVRLMVALGEKVQKGQPVIVVEAMKMENELKSPIAGTVGELLVAAGQTVEAGTKLLRVDS